MIAAPGGDLAVTSIPGDPYSLQALAAQLGSLAAELDEVRAGLSGLQSIEWEGEAAEAFRRVMHQQPRRYADAAESFAMAAGAIAAYSAVLEGAQILAARAGDLTAEAQIATSRWEAAPPGSHPGPDTDPGAALRVMAEQITAGATADLTAATSTLVAILHAAEAGAPRRPSLWHEVATEAWYDAAVIPARVDIGFAKGTWGLIDGAYQLGTLFESETNPAIEVLDPDANRRANAELSAIGTEAWDHPVTFTKTVGEGLVDWREWFKDPAEALGEVLPNVLLTLATTGAATAARASVAAAAIDQAATAGATADAVADAEVADIGDETPPLVMSRYIAEAKFKHADVFGVVEPRGSSGFKSFQKAIQSFLDDSDTVRVRGAYRGAPSILSYNKETLQVVVQDPDGKFISGWIMNKKQLIYVLRERSLGGD